MLSGIVDATLLSSRSIKKSVFSALPKDFGAIFKGLGRRFETESVERHEMPEHLHICLSIPSKYAVSNVVGYIKDKSAIQNARKFEIDKGALLVSILD